MTADEGRALERGTVVYYGTDPRDRGVVVDNNGEVVVVRWGRDRDDSLHVVTNLQRVHRWQRGLRARNIEPPDDDRDQLPRGV